VPSLFIVANHQECTDNTTLSGQEQSPLTVSSAPQPRNETRLTKRGMRVFDRVVQDSRLEDLDVGHARRGEEV
jgi:hypothetical protein